MRTSSYIIPTKVAEDKYILVHGYSGAVDLIDSAIVDVLLNLNGNNQPLETLFEPDTLKTLIARGYITNKSREEEINHVGTMARIIHRRSQLIYSAFTFVVTYDCNFRCPYCFERDIVAKTKGGCRVMTPQVVDDAFKVIQTINSQRKRPSNMITLFGGEPLLKDNLQIVEYIVEQGSKLGFKFCAITNGYDLNHFTHLLSPDKILSIQITLDVMEEIHNSKRVHKDGFPTFNTIVNNIKLALDKGIAVHIRHNTDKNNFTEMVALKDYLTEIGLFENKKLSFGSARLLNHDQNNDASGFFSQMEFIKAHEKKEFKYNCKDFGAYTRLYSAVTNNKPLPYISSFCAAQHGSIVFDPFHKLYPCWEVIGNKQHEIGHFAHGKLTWNKEILSNWSDNYVANIPECRDCKCALLCGGGCAAHNLDRHHCTCMTALINNAAKQLHKTINL